MIAVTLGTLTTATSAVRITSQGWHPNVIVDVILFPAVVAVLLLRRRLGTRVALVLVMGLSVTLSAANYATLGFATTSSLLLAVVCALVAVMAGLRAGFAMLVAVATGIAAIGVGVVAGVVPGSAIDNAYMCSPQGWAMHVVAFALYTAILLVVVSAVVGRFAALLERLSAQSLELAERERRYRHLAENMRDAVFVQDMNLAVTYLSPSAERMFGYTIAEARRVDMAAAMTPESYALVMRSFGEYVRRAMDGPVDVPPLELEYVRKDGSHFWGEMRATILRDERGAPVGTQGTITDISDRKAAAREREELESRLRQAEKLQAIGQLAGGIAHDFNNQLAGIIGYADLLRERSDLDAAARDHANRIISSAQRASELTEKLLAFARKGKLLKVGIDVHAMVDEAISILERSIGKSIRIVRRFDAPRATIVGDPAQIENAILNLGLNARDAMSDGGEMTFATRVVPAAGGAAARLVLAVSDTGVGIEGSIKDRIFEPFFTTKERGTGMGLPAVYGTVMSHEGTIDVETVPGKGSTFTLSFPVADVPVAAAPRVGAAVRGDGRGRILLVDDEDAVRDAVTMMLRRAGYEVESCDDGVRAMEAYAENGGRFAAVVLDMALPGAGGGEVVEAIRRTNPEARILLISGFAADGSVNALLAPGRIAFLKKPFRNDEFVRALGGLLGAE